MAGACEIGFGELFWVARGRPWTDAERERFASVDQAERNRLVRELAAEAGPGVVRVEDRRGTDGVVYAAFDVPMPPALAALEWRAPLTARDPLDVVPEGPGLMAVAPAPGPLVPRRATTVLACLDLRAAAREALVDDVVAHVAPGDEATLARAEALAGWLGCPVGTPRG